MPHPFSYDGKRVVVTGGASGVGAALLDVLAELDVAHVTVVDVREPDGPHDDYREVDLADEVAVDAALT
jgi:NAD(P)-dependent dehydrogenase (short-subunit alcohol dehydrogenase family)